MTGARFLLVAIMTLAAPQIAAAGAKKPTTKPSTQGSFEIKDWSFDAAAKSKGSGSPSSTRNTGSSLGRR
jgi:hypothetical protein